jgi:hypothetical protein
MIRLLLAEDLESIPYEVTVYTRSSEHEIKTSTFICRGPKIEMTLNSIKGLCKDTNPYINWQCMGLLRSNMAVNSGCRVSNLLLISLASKLLKS